ncbi:hypothetical protein CSUB01_10691 [Colletotrichum sublineola]|uniref:Uncharacterized protein n=1 Tax=Colletotrichum sublineola TaxID=1173701 RepID=A0A066XWW6_COLSU|nr:hypothetical protein CSUB01_10691 [Colletotrichum sublineola]
MAELVPVGILDVIELGRQGDQGVSAWLAGFNVSAVTGARRIARNVALTCVQIEFRDVREKNPAFPVGNLGMLDFGKVRYWVSVVKSCQLTGLALLGLCEGVRSILISRILGVYSSPDCILAIELYSDKVFARLLVDVDGELILLVIGYWLVHDIDRNLLSFIIVLLFNSIPLAREGGWHSHEHNWRLSSSSRSVGCSCSRILGNICWTSTPNLLLDWSRLQNESLILWHGFGRRLGSFVFAVLNATEKFLDVHVLGLAGGNAGSHRFCMSVMFSSVASPPVPVVLPVTCLCALVAREPVLDLALLLILVLILAPDKAVRASINDVVITKDVAIIIGDVVSILVIIAFVIAVVLLRPILRETYT